MTLLDVIVSNFKASAAAITYGGLPVLSPSVPPTSVPSALRGSSSSPSVSTLLASPRAPRPLQRWPWGPGPFLSGAEALCGAQHRRGEQLMMQRSSCRQRSQLHAVKEARQQAPDRRLDMTMKLQPCRNCSPCWPGTGAFFNHTFISSLITGHRKATSPHTPSPSSCQEQNYKQSRHIARAPSSK
ncbi:hypothetical protein EYF80_029440 [Liparis tanakae]|uniref:Uncharacterized protein n=1 Tax=Liparis tanakae TaxID=230148 RepID=A0A4Z2H3N7_9TELE|nr:hypothetical protein EYF80_029440 [Liparis tanakae]